MFLLTAEERELLLLGDPLYDQHYAVSTLGAQLRDASDRLRELHVQMDQAVAAAYGWDDLDLEHGFHETPQGARYTISHALGGLIGCWR